MLTFVQRRVSGDRGAVAVIVTLLFASLIVFTLGALAIDSGQFYAEKAQLQNGADAASVAVAKSCAQDLSSYSKCDLGTDPTVTPTPTAVRYADRNANDSKSAVEQICGTMTGGCDAANLCPDPTKSPDWVTGGNWVDVQTRTETSTGDSVLPPIFGKAVLGDNYNGTIHACAQAQWGIAGVPAGSLALTISQCAYNNAISKHNVAHPPPYSPVPGADPGGKYEAVFYFHSDPTKSAGADPTGTDSGCGTPPSGGTPISGGFGSTCQQLSNCSQDSGTCATAFSSAGNWYANNPGASITSSCLTELDQLWKSHTPVLIPVYDCTSNITNCQTTYAGCPCLGSNCGSGSNAAYHLQTLAAFVITGYHMGSSLDRPSWLTDSAFYDTKYDYINGKPKDKVTTAVCGSPLVCISGFFTTADTTGGPIVPGLGTGVTAIKLTG
jgi:hypothetical protein